MSRLRFLTTDAQPVSRLQHAARILLGAALAYAGISHLTWSRTDFLAQVPGDVPLEDRGPPMILGNDFLRAHRVLVAHSQRKFYFTHVGGPVFNAGLPQWTPDAAQCAKGGQPTDARIAACTRAITSGELSSENLGITYNNRGNGWVNNGEYDKAIADYDEAIQLNAQRALTYGNRGNAWYRKGDNDRAIADYGEGDPPESPGRTPLLPQRPYPILAWAIRCFSVRSDRELAPEPQSILRHHMALPCPIA